MVEQHIKPSLMGIPRGQDKPIILEICHSNSGKFQKEEKNREESQNKSVLRFHKLEVENMWYQKTSFSRKIGGYT